MIRPSACFSRWSDGGQTERSVPPDQQPLHPGGTHLGTQVRPPVSVLRVGTHQSWPRSRRLHRHPDAAGEMYVTSASGLGGELHSYLTEPVKHEGMNGGMLHKRRIKTIHL